jgi:hypothetical protein
MVMCRWENTLLNKFLNSKPENIEGYVLLSNMSSAVGNWDFSEKIEQQTKERDVKKQAGWT